MDSFYVSICIQAKIFIVVDGKVFARVLYSVIKVLELRLTLVHQAKEQETTENE